MGTRRNVLTYGIQVLVQFKHFGLLKQMAWGLVGSEPKPSRTQETSLHNFTATVPQPMFIFYFRKFLTFWYKTFPAAAARETNQETKITVLCFGVIYINLMQIMNTKHKHTLLRKKSVIKLKLNLYFILFYFIKNNPTSQFSKFRKYMVNSTFFPAAPQFHNSIRIELEAGQ